MSNLFIIGNGFDLAHDLKTKYADFEDYLKSQIPKASYNCEEGDWQDSFQNISEDSDMIFKLLIEAIDRTEGDSWSNLEESLSKIDYESFLEKNNYENIDILLENLGTRAYVFKDFFDGWINDIKLDNVKPIVAFQSLIKKDDLFLTFNYTKTLEDIYKVAEDSVIHIHGVTGERLKFGHGVEHRYDISDEEQAVHQKLFKDTDKIAMEHIAFFEELPKLQINEIYSYGFSFSEVDHIYLRRIIEKLDTSKITWLFNKRSSTKMESYKDVLKKCGFKGKYKTF